jgi:hypothetical protein
LFIKIRKAIDSDIDQFMIIKEKLAIQHLTNDKATQSGFLLGTDAATYLHYINHDYCYVAEKENAIIGFGIILKNETIKQSVLWQKRNLVNWQINISEIENEKICFFEQLAFLPNHALLATKLLHLLLQAAFNDNHEYILTTTVQKPILNLAAVPFIKKVGGKMIGTIEEQYAQVGAITSSIYLMQRNAVRLVLETYK